MGHLSTGIKIGDCVGLFRRALVVSRLVRNATPLHANGMSFDLRKIYVLPFKRPSFGGQKISFRGAKDGLLDPERYVFQK